MTENQIKIEFKRIDQKLNLIVSLIQTQKKATEALEILGRNNPMKHDMDAYLLAIAGWGLGNEKKPILKNYIG